MILNEKEYTYLIGYQKDPKYRDALNVLVKKIFNLSLEDWYLAGYWKDKYIPYTLFDDDKAVANVSVNIMDFEVLGKQQRFIQIGTVLTHENYRHQNLSRFLLDKVITDWQDKCDLIYLYAKKEVLDMYPKFGFERAKEYECYKSVSKQIEEHNFESLNMDLQSNRDLLLENIANSKPLAKLSMIDNSDLIMFYCITIFRNNIFYIKSLDVIAIAIFKEDELQLLDVFSHAFIDLDKVLYALINPRINKVVLGFTPKNTTSYHIRESSNGDILFFRGKDQTLFEDNYLMFPTLSHA